MIQLERGLHTLKAHTTGARDSASRRSDGRLDVKAQSAVNGFRAHFHRGQETGAAMQEDQIRDALNAHWAASAIGDADAEHDIYADDAVCEYPQSGERIIGRVNLQALRSHHPGKPSGFNVRRILGKGDLWITEYIITYHGRPMFTVSIMEFRDGKVIHETQYFADPFEAPEWRSQWVQRIS